jgi:hypothetical protein
VRAILEGAHENKYTFSSVAGSIEVLVDVLRAHGCSDAAVAEECCVALARVTCNAANAARYGSVPGSVEVMLDVLKAHGKMEASSGALRGCLRAITSLCRSCESSRAQFVERNAVRIVAFGIVVLDDGCGEKQEALDALLGIREALSTDDVGRLRIILQEYAGCGGYAGAVVKAVSGAEQ